MTSEHDPADPGETTLGTSFGAADATWPSATFTTDRIMMKLWDDTDPSVPAVYLVDGVEVTEDEFARARDERGWLDLPEVDGSGYTRRGDDEYTRRGDDE